jgi:hypothetical protein
MKIVMMAAWAALVVAGPVFAAETAPPPNVPGPTFEQRKAEILMRIDERIVRNQQEKSCIQAAKTPGDVKACQDKRAAEIRAERQTTKK